MNYLALGPHAGQPIPGDLVWSALPDSPIEEPRAAGLLMRVIRRLRRHAPLREQSVVLSGECPQEVAHSTWQSPIPSRADCDNLD